MNISGGTRRLRSERCWNWIGIVSECDGVFIIITPPHLLHLLLCHSSPVFLPSPIPLLSLYYPIHHSSTTKTTTTNITTPVYVLHFISRGRLFVFFFLFPEIPSSKAFQSSFNLQVCSLFHSYSPLKGLKCCSLKWVLKFELIVVRIKSCNL